MQPDHKSIASLTLLTLVFGCPWLTKPLSFGLLPPIDSPIFVFFSLEHVMSLPAAEEKSSLLKSEVVTDNVKKLSRECFD